MSTFFRVRRIAVGLALLTVLAGCSAAQDSERRAESPAPAKEPAGEAARGPEEPAALPTLSEEPKPLSPAGLAKGKSERYEIAAASDQPSAAKGPKTVAAAATENVAIEKPAAAAADKSARVVKEPAVLSPAEQPPALLPLEMRQDQPGTALAQGDPAGAAAVDNPLRIANSRNSGSSAKSLDAAANSKTTPKTNVPATPPPSRQVAVGPAADPASKVEAPPKTDVVAKKEPPAETKIASTSNVLKAAGVPPTQKHSDVPFDPVKENGAIFVDWSKPKLALVFTGRQDGYLEPCGCAGLDRMKGGMSRRYSLFKTLRQQGWPVVGIDVGGIAKGFGRQAELKYQIAIEAMRTTGYQAIGLGAADLQLPAEEVLAAIAPVNNQTSPFVSANVGLFEFDESVLSSTRILDVAGKKLGITAVLGKSFHHQINNPSIKLTDPEEALARRLPGLKQQADLLILLAYATKQESVALANKFPDFDLVITSGGPAEPPAQSEEAVKGGTRLIEVGEKGMYAIVLGVYDEPRRVIRYQRVPLDSRFAASGEMRTLMAAYQDQVKKTYDRSPLRPLPHPMKDVGGRFVGTEKCQSCHEESYAVWKKSKHSQAFASLQQANPPRDFDPECVSCHVVGWHPTKFFPYEGGYVGLAKTPQLTNVGCETCHGPGEAHAAAELLASDKVRLEVGRKSVHLTKEEAADPTSKKQNCYSCHDLDNSPEFKFKDYWPLVEHYEKE